MAQTIQANTAGGGRCATRYPIILVHGTGFHDRWYWGRIPGTLRREGAQVFGGRQERWATVERNAQILKARVEEVLALTGREKVHLIAHSKGGLDARYMISGLGMAGRVASLSTISTPHHGSKTMDALQRMPRWVFGLAGVFVNGVCRLTGDRDPDFCAVCRQFTTGWANEFNRANPDAPGVLYRSWAGVMTSWRSDLCMGWANLVVRRADGENDGLVSAESARWTGFAGEWRGAGGRGVSHMDEVDFWRRSLRHRGERFDVTEQYVRLVEQLKELGL